MEGARGPLRGSQTSSYQSDVVHHTVRKRRHVTWSSAGMFTVVILRMIRISWLEHGEEHSTPVWG